MESEETEYYGPGLYPPEDDDDDDPWLEELDLDCGQMPDGYCDKAGSEECDDCPYNPMNSRE